jgi:hypothetical protein
MLTNRSIQISTIEGKSSIDSENKDQLIHQDRENKRKLGSPLPKVISDAYHFRERRASLYWDLFSIDPSLCQDLQ